MGRFSGFLCLFFAATIGMFGESPGKDCIVAGVVTESGTGKPVRRASVVMISSQHADQSDAESRDAKDVEESSVQTDNTGHFEIRNLAPGEYVVSVEKNGYGKLRAANSKTWDESITLSLTSGQELRHFGIELEPTVVISGRVIDEEGEPMAKVQVSAMQKLFANGQRTQMATEAAFTNDKGEYRIFGLAPGSYFVRAEVPGSAIRPRTGYAPMFYPDARSLDQAMTVALKPGSEGHADIRLVPTRLARIRGRVLGMAGNEGVSVNLRASDGHSVSAAAVSADGKFKMDGILPGDYVLLAMQLLASGEDHTATPEMTEGEAPLKIDGANVDDVNIVLSKPAIAILHATLKLANADVPHPDFSSLGIVLTRQDVSSGLASSSDASSNIESDGTIPLDPLRAGVYRLAIIASDTAWEDYYTRTVRLAGKDITDSAFELPASDGIPLEITLDSDGASVEGTVVDESGAPVADAMVVGVPKTELRGQADLFQKSTSDERGFFRLRGIKPGTYTLFAWNTTDGGKFMDPEFLTQFDGQGTRLELNAGERKSQQLKLLISDQY